MIPGSWRDGEVAVLGMARTGEAVGRWLAAHDVKAYISDSAHNAKTRAAAERMAALGHSVDCGRHDIERIRRAGAVIVSPGLPPSAPPVEAARGAGVPVLAELEVAQRALSNTRLIVVTGTNGKSTTTALVAHLLSVAGFRAEAAGNIGRPLIDLALDSSAFDWIAVEASSFQLHDWPSVNPVVGVLTNLSADHLDRYSSMEEYYGDKKRMFRNASSDSVWVLNGDDEAVLELARDAAGRHVHFRMNGNADAWYDAGSRQLMLGGEPLIERNRFPLIGAHNVENALAAALAVHATGVAADAISLALETAKPLPHRLEPVRLHQGVNWINDSKATNMASTMVALRAVEGQVVLILGGRHKGEPFTQLIPLLQGRTRAIVAYGESSRIIADELGARFRVEEVADLRRGVVAAWAMAEVGDTVLLSPACSSFDLYENFEHRGIAFRQLVESL